LNFNNGSSRFKEFQRAGCRGHEKGIDKKQLLVMRQRDEDDVIEMEVPAHQQHLGSEKAHR
jgi:hypothetical protein